MFVQKRDDYDPNTEVDEVNPATLRRVWYLAHACLLANVALFTLLAVLYDKPWDDIWQLVVAHVVAGRPGSAGFGLERGFDSWFILYASCMQDLVVMLYLYPLLVAGYKKMTHLPVVGVRLLQVHEKAWQHHHRIAPYGAIGIFAFVFLPLMGTGPIVGMLIGYIIGLSTPVTIGSAFAGVAASTVAWIWGYKWLHDYNSTLAMWGMLSAFALVVCTGVTIKIVSVIRRRRRVRAAGGAEGTSL